MMDHHQLLAEYARTGSDAAFRELVTRYVDLVYSTAVRLVGGDAHLAQDVAQTVFLNLSSKAKTLPTDVMLGGWLHRDTCFVAAKLMRTERRRQLRERQAVEMNAAQNDSGADFTRVAPLLDDAINELAEDDRTAVLLRFYEQRDFRSVGAALGSNEDAARMRVNRALDKLQELLKRRGITTTAATLSMVLAANAVQAAPAGLALTISTTMATAGTAAVATITTAKIIAMTTLQKTLVAAVVVAAVGVGFYEFRENARLRQELAALKEQQSFATAVNATATAQNENSARETEPQRSVAQTAANTASEWAERLRALNGGDWRQAFALGQKLAAIPPAEGLAILQSNWSGVTNVDARQQLLKAFSFAQHERLPAVLELGVLDASPDVQNWALNYLKDISLQDFSSDHKGAVDWLATKRELTLAAAFTESVWSLSHALREADADIASQKLELLKRAGDLLKKYPEVISAAGLSQTFAELAKSSDPKIVSQTLSVARNMSFDDEWLRSVALPKLGADNPAEVRAAAAMALAGPGREWAMQPLLDALTVEVRSSERSFGIPQALSEIGSPKAIPMMIALIEADNTYDTVYGIGYFGLGKLTGVTYDQKHDGAWWRQWWENNKQRFPADVQAIQIPRLEPVQRNQARNP